MRAKLRTGELRSPGKLKHAPPMRRSHLEMAKLQIGAQIGLLLLRPALDHGQHCNGPQKLDTKRPFLRWWAALKMKESQCPEHVRVTRPDRTDVRRPPDPGRRLEETGVGRVARRLRQRPRTDAPTGRRRKGRAL